MQASSTKQMLHTFYSAFLMLFIVSCEAVQEPDIEPEPQAQKEPTYLHTSVGWDKAWASDNLAIDWWEYYYYEDDVVPDCFPELTLSIDNNLFPELMIVQAIMLDVYRTTEGGYPLKHNANCSYYLEIDMEQLRNESTIDELPLCSGRLQFTGHDSLSVFRLIDQYNIDTVLYDTLSITLDQVWFSGAGLDYQRANIISYNLDWEISNAGQIAIEKTGRLIADFLTRSKDSDVNFLTATGESYINYTYAPWGEPCATYFDRLMLMLDEEEITTIIISGSFESLCRLMSFDVYLGD